MSAARSLLPYPGILGLKMTAEEYLALGETTERTELLNGVVVSMSPSRIPRHWKVIEELLFQLEVFVRSGGLADAYADTDLKIRDLAVLRPDLSVYARPVPVPIPARLVDAPDLIIEVLSPGSEAYDLITKRGEYEQRGIREYWVIDPADASIRVWRREGDRFAEANLAFLSAGSNSAALTSSAIKGFTLDRSALRRAIGILPS